MQNVKLYKIKKLVTSQKLKIETVDKKYCIDKYRSYFIDPYQVEN